jgi:hypothetical protein
LGVLPLAVLTAAAALTRAAAGDGRPVRAIVLRYVYTLVPFGCGVWLAHYGFHLLTGFFAVVPVVQTAALDLVGWPALGEPLWGWAGMRPGAVFPLQMGAVVLGALGSAGIVFRAALDDLPDRPARAALPWLCLVLALAAAALFTFAQPMEMRGTSGIG